ncbi:MAG: ATP-binding protein [Ottowia sp.]|nr:ATP-binding protein [Ottowia sp.]
MKRISVRNLYIRKIRDAKHRDKSQRTHTLTPDLSPRIHQLLTQLAPALPPLPLNKADWQAFAFRWRQRESLLGRFGFLQPIKHLPTIQLEDLHCIDTQKAKILANTQQFVSGLPANNVLLTGARGTGKSSLIKACLQQFAHLGLRLVEIDKAHLNDLGDIVELLAPRPERFILFCDDLSFTADEPGYNALKSSLDGSVATLTNNILVYATSNRRHLAAEYMQDNLAHQIGQGEIHPGEAVEEKISLSERFGLWLSFYPPKQDAYLQMVTHWLAHFHGDTTPAALDIAHAQALIWALERGSRSGRVAWQFARDYVGRLSLP